MASITNNNNQSLTTTTNSNSTNDDNGIDEYKILKTISGIENKIYNLQAEVARKNKEIQLLTEEISKLKQPMIERRKHIMAASIPTTNPPPTKRRCTSVLQPATIEALEEERAEPIEIGILVLPAGFESACGIMTKILLYLDIRSLCNVKRSSLIQQCRKRFGCDDFERVRDVALKLDYEGRRSINEMRLSHPARRLYLLIERYKNEFPHGTGYGGGDEIPIPIVCACERGRMDDVELFVNLHPFHKYITNRDVNGYRDDMTLKEYVNQVGTDSRGREYTPLMPAALNEHFHVVKYLIEQGEADPNIARSDGFNALHLAAGNNRTNTELIELLLTHMSLDSINKKNGDGETPLDRAYAYNDSPIRQEIIALLRSKGGKANNYDENGRYVGEGNGDLNH